LSTTEAEGIGEEERLRVFEYNRGRVFENYRG